MLPKLLGYCPIKTPNFVIKLLEFYCTRNCYLPNNIHCFLVHFVREKQTQLYWSLCYNSLDYTLTKNSSLSLSSSGNVEKLFSLFEFQWARCALEIFSSSESMSLKV